MSVQQLQQTGSHHSLYHCYNYHHHHYGDDDDDVDYADKTNNKRADTGDGSDIRITRRKHSKKLMINTDLEQQQVPQRKMEHKSCCAEKQIISNFYNQEYSTLSSPPSPLPSTAVSSLAALSSPSTAEPSSSSSPFIIEIKLLAYNRYASIKRCLASLKEAEYGSDRVDLTVFLDHFPYQGDSNKARGDYSDDDSDDDASVDTTQKEADFREKLDLQYKILEMIREFEWPHGKMSLHMRHKNGNLQVAWLEAFYPLDNDTYAFIVEDDIQVSPFYYMYLKKLITKYRYPHLMPTSTKMNGEDQHIDRHIYGISFQRQHLVPGYWSRKSVHVDNQEQPYLYQLVGTWGQIVFPEHWREFRQYYDQRFSHKHLKPNLDGLITDHWYKQKGEKIWTPWFIRFVFAKNYYNLYTNFPGDKALSTSHRDSGENYKWFSRGADADIMTYQNDVDLFKTHMDKELVDAPQLKRYDYCFQEVPRGSVTRLFQSGALPFKEDNNYALIFTHFDHSEKYLRNQLCYLEQHASRSDELELRQSILFVTNSSGTANELAYLGYQAIYFDLSVKSHNEIEVVKWVANNMSPTNLLFVSSTDRSLIKKNPVPSRTLSAVKPMAEPELHWLIISSDLTRSAFDIARNRKPKTFVELVDLLQPDSSKVVVSKLSDQTVAVVSDNAWSKVSVIREDDFACTRVQCWR